MMSRTVSLLAVMCVPMLVGCATMEGRWQKARSLDSIQGYEDFLKRHPEAALARLAEVRLEELRYAESQTQNSIEAYREYLTRYPRGVFAAQAKARMTELFLKACASARSARMVIEQSFGGVSADPLPFEDAVGGFLRCAGVRIVTPEEQADLIVSVRSKAKAVGAYYSDRRYYYTGAVLEGTVAFETMGYRYPMRFDGSSGNRPGFDPQTGETTVGGLPYEIIPGGYSQDPSKAPFYSAFTKSSFEDVLRSMFTAVYGVEFLISVLRENCAGPGRAEDAARILIQSQDSVAISAVIDVMDAETVKFETSRNTWDRNKQEMLIRLFGDIGGTWAIEPLERVRDILGRERDGERHSYRAKAAIREIRGRQPK